MQVKLEIYMACYADFFSSCVWWVSNDWIGNWEEKIPMCLSVSHAVLTGLVTQHQQWREITVSIWLQCLWWSKNIGYRQMKEKNFCPLVSCQSSINVPWHWFYISLELYWGMNTIVPKDPPSGYDDGAGNHTVYWDLVTLKVIIWFT